MRRWIPSRWGRTNGDHESAKWTDSRGKIVPSDQEDSSHTELQRPNLWKYQTRVKKFARYEPNQENPPFSINDTKDVTANLINFSNAVQDPKYRDSPKKLVIWLRRFMMAHNVDYVKESYLEGIQFMQDEVTDVSLKHRLWFLRLQDAT